MWHADAASITSCNDCRQAGNKFWELRANVVHKTSQACIRNIFLAALGQVHASIGPPSRCYDWGCHDCKIQVFKYVSGFF